MPWVTKQRVKARFSVELDWKSSVEVSGLSHLYVDFCVMVKDCYSDFCFLP